MEKTAGNLQCKGNKDTFVSLNHQKVNTTEFKVMAKCMKIINTSAKILFYSIWPVKGERKMQKNTHQ